MAENIQEPAGKACCPDESPRNSAKRAGSVAVMAGLGAALLGSLCCAGPLIAILLGVSGATALAGLGKYHTLLLAAIGVVFLAAGVYFWRFRKACDLPNQNIQLWKYLAIAAGLFVVTTFIINQVVIPMMSTRAYPTLATKPLSLTGMHKATLAIDQMECAACVGTIQKSIATTPGVIDASVSYEKKQASVIYDPTKTNVQLLVDAVAKTNYQAKVIADKPAG